MPSFFPKSRRRRDLLDPEAPARTPALAPAPAQASDLELPPISPASTVSAAPTKSSISTMGHEPIDGPGTSERPTSASKQSFRRSLLSLMRTGSTRSLNTVNPTTPQRPREPTQRSAVRRIPDQPVPGTEPWVNHVRRSSAQGTARTNLQPVDTRLGALSAEPAAPFANSASSRELALHKFTFGPSNTTSRDTPPSPRSRAPFSANSSQTSNSGSGFVPGLSLTQLDPEYERWRLQHQPRVPPTRRVTISDTADLNRLRALRSHHNSKAPDRDTLGPMESSFSSRRSSDHRQYLLAAAGATAMAANTIARHATGTPRSSLSGSNSEPIIDRRRMSSVTSGGGGGGGPGGRRSSSVLQIQQGQYQLHQALPRPPGRPMGLRDDVGSIDESGKRTSQRGGKRHRGHDGRQGSRRAEQGFTAEGLAEHVLASPEQQQLVPKDLRLAEFGRDPSVPPHDPAAAARHKEMPQLLGEIGLLASYQYISGGNLIFCPPARELLQRKSPVPRILDHGGSPAGNFSVQVALSFPNAHVYCVSVVNPLPRIRHPPRNLISVRETTTPNRLPFPDESFDVISSRFLPFYVKHWEWADMVRELLRVLRPGGYFEASILDSQLINPGPMTAAYNAHFTASLANKGFDPNIARRIMNIMEECGFSEIMHVHLAIPGVWGGRISEVAKIINSRIFEPWFDRIGQPWAESAAERTERTKSEWMRNKTAVPWLFLYAQKPHV